MDDEAHNPPDEEHDLERKIREHRKFSLAEAIGRLGGAGIMKGASPVTLQRQAELVLEDYLEKQLTDSGGALEIVLLRRVAGSQLLMENSYERPLVALGKYCQRLLDSPSRLADFVREVDAQWGQMYQERPHFDRPGHPPHEDDPYTQTSVRGKLDKLLATLMG